MVVPREYLSAKGWVLESLNKCEEYLLTSVEDKERSDIHDAVGTYPWAGTKSRERNAYVRDGEKKKLKTNRAQQGSALKGTLGHGVVARARYIFKYYRDMPE